MILPSRDKEKNAARVCYFGPQHAWERHANTPAGFILSPQFSMWIGFGGCSDRRCGPYFCEFFRIPTARM